MYLIIAPCTASEHLGFTVRLNITDFSLRRRARQRVEEKGIANIVMEQEKVGGAPRKIVSSAY